MQINDDWAGGRQASSKAAAQTGIVSVAGIRLDPGKFVRPFKGIFCDDFLSSSPTNSAMQSVSIAMSGTLQSGGRGNHFDENGARACSSSRCVRTMPAVINFALIHCKQ